MKRCLVFLLYVLSTACYAQVNDFINFRNIAQLEDSIKQIESHYLRGYHYLHQKDEADQAGLERYYSFWTDMDGDMKKGAIIYKQGKPIINFAGYYIHQSVRLTNEDEEMLIQNRKTVHIVYYFYKRKVVYIAERIGKMHTKTYILSDDKFIILDNDRLVKLTEDRKKYVNLQLQATRFLQNQYDKVQEGYGLEE
jgi:hypothetical protein